MNTEVIIDRHELLLMLQEAYRRGDVDMPCDALRDGWNLANEKVDDWERMRKIRKNSSPAQKMIDIYDLKA